MSLLTLLSFISLLSLMPLLTQIPQTHTHMKNNRKTIGIRNNNPCNIKHSSANNWAGQIGSNRNFCVFSSPLYGLRAAFVLIRKLLYEAPITHGERDNKSLGARRQLHRTKLCTIRGTGMRNNANRKNQSG